LFSCSTVVSLGYNARGVNWGQTRLSLKTSGWSHYSWVAEVSDTKMEPGADVPLDVPRDDLERVITFCEFLQEEKKSDIEVMERAKTVTRSDKALLFRPKMVMLFFATLILLSNSVLFGGNCILLLS
jgi:hypothetical protein